MPESYYRIPTDTDNNFKITDNYLTVNCTGFSSFTDEQSVCSVRHDYYMIYMCSGRVSVSQPNVSRELLPGDMIIFSPETTFSYHNPPDSRMDYYWVHFSGFGANELLSQCRIKTNTILTPGTHKDIEDAFRLIFSAFLTRDLFFETEASSALTALAVKAGRHITHSDQNGFRGIDRALYHIHSNIESEISVGELAKLEHLSVSRFRAVFTGMTGVSPQTYIQSTKIRRACQLLRQTSFTITEISRKSGYSDPQYFSRIFKKVMGISPKEYRKREK